MLPFFRKIRYRLAKDNQFLKYSRYAIGEIVLVVVGILIALYINNWNEQRKEREKFDQILVEVEKELVLNITEVRRAIRYYGIRDSLCARILLDTLDLEDYKRSGSDLLRSINNYTYPVIKDESYKSLIEVNNLDSKQDSLLKMLNHLNGYLKRQIEFIANRIMKNTEGNTEMYKKYEWFKDFRLNRLEDAIIADYFLTGSEFSNAVADYWNVANNLTNYGTRFETLGVKTYKLIHNYLQDKNANHEGSFIVDQDLSEFKHYVGKYELKWISRLNWWPDYYAIIHIEKDKLIYTGYRANEQKPKRREIIPENKFYFRTDQGGHYRILFEKSKEVDGIFISLGPKHIMELKKVR